MERAKKLSILSHLWVGIGLGALLSLSYAYLLWYSFVYYFVSFYGIFYLLALPYARKVSQVIYTTVLPALLACLPFAFHLVQHTFSAIVLSVISAYMLNSFHLHYLKHHWKQHYNTLFYAVWDSFVRVVAVALFMGACWVILLLTCNLFGLIKITFLQNWVDNTAFDIFCLSIFASVGFYLTTKTVMVLHQVRAIVLMIARVLLVPLSIIGILFVLAAIVMFLLHRQITLDQFSLMLMAFLSVIFINALYEDGHTDWQHHPVLVQVYRVFLIIVPFFTCLALYVLLYQAYDSIMGNGVNLGNFPYLLNVLLLLAYNLAYAIMACRRRKLWLQGIECINVSFAWIVIFASLLTTNPLFVTLFPKTGMWVESSVVLVSPEH